MKSDSSVLGVRREPIAMLAFLFILLATIPALGQGSKADYERSKSYDRRTQGKVFRDRVDPQWIDDGPDFWYRIDAQPDASEFILVRPRDEKPRRMAFDHERVALALSEATGRDVSRDRLPFREIAFEDGFAAVRFKAFGRAWRCDLASYELKEAAGLDASGGNGSLEINALRPSGGSADDTSLRFVNERETPIKLFWVDSSSNRQGYGAVPPGQSRDQHTFAGHVWLVTDDRDRPLGVFVGQLGEETIVIDADREPIDVTPRRPQGRRSSSGTSPDGRWRAAIVDNNVVLRAIDGDKEHVLSTNGTADDPYEPRFSWSPDSKRLVVMQPRKGQNRQVHLIESSPKDQLQPKLHTFTYDKPGDRIAMPRPRLFDVETKAAVDVSEDLFPNPWSIQEIRWADDSSRFTFFYNQRGHQVLRIVAVDAQSGETRAIVDEVCPTFFDYTNKRFTRYLDATDEIIWMSERDGWNHLYLYDATTGKVKRQITSGEWVVRGVERVDEEKREIWFQAGGVHPEQDPYYLHLCRVDIDSGETTVLTEGDGTHTWTFSPDGEFFLDTYSRVDQPPIVELRRSEDGKLLDVLEHADWSRLMATGWRPPERFVAKGRDGETDIYGIIVRPTNFDPEKTYPVVEKIYAGPHGAFVPKSFGRNSGAYAIAELGFLVVQIDGMGTSHRSKAFHDVCWKNLGDSGFPDRILWMQAAAKQRPEMDLTRVGIFGGSAGGQSAVRALLAHGDFYKVAVADCGCHDNRMDKIWWNEQWMGWPVGPHYEDQSNVTQAHRLTGKLLLVVGELDRNVDPASTMQVVDALIKADKDFDLLIIPGAGHGAAESTYGKRRRADFLVRGLLGVEPRWEAKAD